MDFFKKILTWYINNKRELPWRSTRDPYKIWLSEIILQQTRVVQGLPYYTKFVERFPTVGDLASADEEEVLKLWQGLGYYSRARNLHTTAKKVAFEMNGQFPETYGELLKLKGIGDYTASAIASICFDAPHPVVDGNVYRVLARYFGVDRPINGPEGPTFFKQLASEVMAPENIRDYNQGIMEFGAVQCTPQSPNCDICPLNADCIALATGKVGELPVKLKKTKIRKRYFNYLVLVDPHEGTLLQKRIGNDIWQNLWEFPLVESDKLLDLSAIQEMPHTIPEITQEAVFHEYTIEPIVHKLSHQHLITKFWIVEIPGPLPHAVPITKLVDYPVPVLVANFIKAFKKSYF